MSCRRVLHSLLLLGVATVLLGTTRAYSGVAPEGSTTHVRTAQRGEIYRGSIVVRNTGEQPADIKVYQTDYVFTAEGRSEYGTPGELPRSNAKWLRLGQEQVTVAPGKRVSMDYEVRVPDDASLTGTYWSAIMIQPIVGMEAAGKRGARAQLRQVIRHAIQVITEIGESGTGAIAFDNARLLLEDGTRWFAFDIGNVGERWLRTDVWLELRDSQGRPVGRFPGRRLRTFPGTSVRNRIDLSAVSPGRYLALLVADGGRNDLFGTQLELDIR